MGNRALRKRAGQLLKQAGHGKRLWRGSKRRGRSHFNARHTRHVIERLERKPGDLVNDCDGFNHVIKDYIIWWGEWDTNFLVVNVDQYAFEDGRWSCGCPYGPVDAWTVDQIRNFHDLSDETIESHREGGWWTEKNQKLIDRIRSGDPITDERGVKLPLE